MVRRMTLGGLLHISITFFNCMGYTIAFCSDNARVSEVAPVVRRMTLGGLLHISTILFNCTGHNRILQCQCEGWRPRLWCAG